MSNLIWDPYASSGSEYRDRSEYLAEKDEELRKKKEALEAELASAQRASVMTPSESSSRKFSQSLLNDPGVSKFTGNDEYQPQGLAGKIETSKAYRTIIGNPEEGYGIGDMANDLANFAMSTPGAPIAAVAAKGFSGAAKGVDASVDLAKLLASKTPTVVKQGLGIGAAATGYEMGKGATYEDYANERDTLPSQAGASLRAGVGSTLENFGSMAEWMGKKDTGQSLKQTGQNVAEGFEVNPVPFTWKSLLDPNWYANNAAQSVPSTAALIPLMYAGYKVSGGAAGKLGAGPMMKTIIASLGGTALSRPVESAMEAGSTYQDALNAGDSEEIASAKADQVYYDNLKLAGLDAAQLAVAFAPEGKIASRLTNAIGKSGTAATKLAFEAGTEAGEEGYQQAAQMQAQGTDNRSKIEQITNPDAQMQESMAMGGLMGGFMGAAGVVNDIYSNPQDFPNKVIEHVAANLSPELKTQVAQNIENNMSQGMDEATATEKAMDEFAETPEGQEIIHTSTQAVAAAIQQQAAQKVIQNTVYHKKTGEALQVINQDNPEMIVVQNQEGKKSIVSSADITTEKPTTSAQNMPTVEPVQMPSQEVNAPQASQEPAQATNLTVPEQPVQQEVVSDNVAPAANDQIENPTDQPATTKKPTPGQNRIIQRGKHGQVRVTFPDSNHADLFDFTSKVKKSIEGTKPMDVEAEVKRLKYQHKLPEESNVGAVAQDYRQHIIDSVKDLPKGSTYKAPSLEEYLASRVQEPATEKANAPISPVIDFKTEQGSTYTVEGDSTQRNKSQHKRHDVNDVGLKEKSEKTVYVSPELAKEIGMWQTSSAEDKRIAITSDGKVILLSKNPQTGEIGRDKIIGDDSYAVSPEVGKNPLELWGGREDGTYSGNHPGNTIIEVNTQPESAAPAPQEEKPSESTISQVDKSPEKPTEEPVTKELEGYTITKTKHTQTGADLWVVKPTKRLSPQDFTALRVEMKKLGGGWSRFTKGFNFKEDPTAKLQPKQESRPVVAEKPVAAEAKPVINQKPDNSNQVKSLREQADRMQKSIDEKKNPAVSNQNPTARRANIAAGMYAQAERLEEIQGKLNAVADAIESGTAPAILHNIKKKTHIETLRQEIRNAQSRMVKAENIPYSKTPELSSGVIKYAKIEGYVHPDHLKTLLTETKGKSGTKDAAALVQRIVNSGGRFYAQSGLKAIETLLAKLPDSNSAKKYIKDGIADYKRIMDMGVTTDDKLQELLKAYLEVGGSTVKEKSAGQKIKEMERELLGSKIPGYFPTPKPVIAEMLDQADIQPGMRVLEPSAGKGSIADAIKEAEPEAIIDVVEINHTLQNILKQKGYNLVGTDFLELTGEYDRIVMNPPFEKGQDMDHVRHAYDLLNPGGKVVAIMSEGTFFRGDKKASEFREWMTEQGGTNEKLPNKSFTGKDSDRQTGVATRIVAIDKPARQESDTKETTTVYGKTAIAKTERGTAIDAQYAIVEAENLIASHSTELKENKDYPQELQPRDRTRAASEAQITKIAGNLEPEFLGESPKASEGAPIIGPDMVVESGNGRVIALKRVYEGNVDNAVKYKQWLADNADKFGIKKEDLAGIKNPVLVRIRQSDVDRLSFVKEANEQATAAMSATEQGKADAEKLTPEMMAIFSPAEDGQILNKDNRFFVREFMGKIIGAAEQSRYATSDGSISQEGVSRIRNAIFAKAYNDAETLEKLSESTDNNVKNITNAMLMVAPKMAALKSGIAEGNFYSLDISKEIGEAVKKLSQLREQGTEVDDYLNLENQDNLFGEKELSPLTKDILTLFNKYKRSSKTIAKILSDYIDGVIAAGDPNQGQLCGHTPPPTKAEILDASLKRMEGHNEQTSLFENETIYSQENRAANGRAGGKTGQSFDSASRKAKFKRGDEKPVAFSRRTTVPKAAMPEIFRKYGWEIDSHLLRLKYPVTKTNPPNYQPYVEKIIDRQLKELSRQYPNFGYEVANDAERQKRYDNWALPPDLAEFIAKGGTNRRSQDNVPGETGNNIQPGRKRKLKTGGISDNKREYAGREQIAPVFYSQLQRVIEQKMPNKAVSSQVLAIIKGGQVKADEIKWSGIEEWLKDQSGRVNKGDVLNYLKANDLQIKEVSKSEDQKEAAKNATRFYVDNDNEAWSPGEIIDGANDIRISSEDDDMPLIRDIATAISYMQTMGHDVRADGKETTKYGNYALSGGENYRELLFTLPGKARDVRRLGNDYWSIDGRTATREEALSIDTAGQYHSTHWSEPNVLAHVRLDDRTDENGEKVLFIEEVQSDWHQEGRRKGYSSNAEAIKARITKEYKVPEDIGEWSLNILDKAGVPKDLQNQWYDSTMRGKVPDAPFKTTWPELVMKRMLHYAAENGYDRIAWTTGEQQAARYDLSKQVESVYYTKNGYEKKGDQIWVVVKAKNNPNNIIAKYMLPDEIEATLGKDIAQKIVSGEESDTIEGLDLKVGGEGMKVFYDKILPAFLNRYVKKWGTKVEELNLGKDAPPFTVEEVGVNGGEYTIFKDGEPWEPGDDVSTNRAEKQALVDAFNADYDKKEIMVHSLPITTAMKESVIYEGQPKFKLSEDPHLNTLSQELGVDLKPAPIAMNRPAMQAANILVNIFTGRNLIPFRGGNIQGVADNNSIYINEKTRDPLMYVVKHEIVHTLGTTDPDSLKQFMDLVEEYFNGDLKMVKQYLKQGYEAEEIWEEFTSDVISEVMEEPGFWSKVREKAPQVIKIIIDLIDQLISGYKKAVGKNKSMLKYIRDLEEFKDKVAGVVANHLDNSRKSIFDLRSADQFAAKMKRGEPGPKFTLPDEEVQTEIEASNGLPKIKMRENLAAAWDEVYRRAHREFEWLPRNDPRFAKLRMVLLHLRKQKGVTGHKAGEYLDSITKELTEQEYEVFRYKVVFDDLAAGIEANEINEETKLPFKLTMENFPRNKEAVDKQVEAMPNVQKAMEKRQEAWDEVKAAYIAAQKAVKFDVEKKLTRKDYFHHHVLEYVKDKTTLLGSGKQLHVQTNRGFLRNRQEEGSSKNFNTDYLQSEFEVMGQMLLDAEPAKVVKLVMDEHDILSNLKRQAVQQNNEGMMQYFQELIDKYEIDSTPEKEYRKVLNRKQAIAYSQLYKLAAMGELPNGNGRYDQIIEEMTAAYWEAKHAKADYADLEEEGMFAPSAKIPDEMQGKLMAYLNYLAGQVESKEGQIKARTVFKGMAEKQRVMKNTLGNEYATWQKLVPPGYTTWQPQQGHMFFKANSIQQGVTEMLADDLATEVNISKTMIRSVLAVGQNYPELVVPEEVARTLDNLYEDNSKHGLAYGAYRYAYRLWKEYVLINPRRWFKYNARNLSGDADAVFTFNPSGFSKLSEAFEDLRKAYFTKEKTMSPKLREWFERGGFETLMQVQEISDINKNRQFRHLIESRMKQSTWEKTLKSPLTLFNATRDFLRASTDFREALLRYADFIDRYEQMNNNPEGKPKGFGASYQQDVMALDDLYDRAFKLSNEEIGAYDQVSVYGSAVADWLMPFWRWKEVNFFRYMRGFRNAFADGEGMATVGRKFTGLAIRSPLIAARVGRLVLKGFILVTLLTAWNMLFFRDEEDDLPEDVRNKVHIVLGRNSDGSVRYFDKLGAAQDFLAWFGLDTPAQTARDFLNGKKSLKEVAIDVAKQDINAVWQAITPFAKSTFELAMGKKTYPDVFDAVTIRDRGQYIADTLSLGEEYKAATGKPTRSGYLGTMPGILYYQVDPYEAAYFANKEHVAKFNETLGNGTGGGSSPRSDALYNIKLSMRYGDKEALNRYLAEYVAKGGTAKGLKQSIGAMSPIYGLNEAELQVYVNNYLDAEGKEDLAKAIKYYQDVIQGEMFKE